MKLYAWILTSSTLLLLGLLLWPLSVKTFRSTASFQLVYQPESGIEKTSLNGQVTAALREQTAHDKVTALIAALKAPVTSPVLKSGDAGQVRNAISIRARLGDSANSADYQIVLQGTGGRDEIEFLNTLVVNINTSLNTRFHENNATGIVDQLSRDFMSFHVGVVDRMASQVNAVAQGIETVRNDIQIISNDLASYQPAAAGSGQRRPLGRARDDQSESRLARLLAEKQELLAQPGMTPYHWQVTAVQKQIESLQHPAPTSGGGSFQAPSGTDASLVKNRFAAQSGVPASIDRPGDGSAFDASLTHIIDGIRGINLQIPQRELASLSHQMQDSRENAETLVGRLNQSAQSGIQVRSPIAMSDFQRAASSLPVGGVPTGRNFLWLGVFAGLLGGSIALNFDPALKTRPFRSIAQMQNKLGLPVIGLVRSIRTIRQPRSFRRQIATSLVKYCEWTLLGIGVLLLLAAILNSHVAAAFLENPFHGITRTVWMLTSHS